MADAKACVFLGLGYAWQNRKTERSVAAGNFFHTLILSASDLEIMIFRYQSGFFGNT
jgi:hypothetical protein